MAFMDTENASSSFSSFPSSSSSSTPGWKYDVFLSFRGTDTRKNFTDHLYPALSQKGIFTFRDDEKLERGTFISPELLSAIEDSRFAVVILSRDYASSSWCLIELAKIVECMEKKGLIVLPVFHYVDPSDVRNQRGAFAEAFVKHEERFKDNIEDVHEAKVIEEMVRKILGKLYSTYSDVHKDLVGINSRMEEMVNLLAIGLNDVRFVGICGMGGIGKTTLARLIYNKLHYYFEGSSFLANVREESKKHGLVPLQKRLLADIFPEKNIDFLDVQWGINMIGKRLCHKRVLAILDDVDQLDQLEALETDDEALHFFSLKAFKKDYPSEGYEVLSQKVICYAQGLPLTLEVLGRFLFRRSVDEWESALCRLKEGPERQISDVLKITFDGLREREKNIFLDIACFFKGMEEDHVVNILQALYVKPKIDIVVLLEKSLITISFGKFWMHDLLQELGNEIVCCESPEEPS
nr:TMV resistance protein N-like [Quercus suber]